MTAATETTIAPGDEANCVSCGCRPGCDCPEWCTYEEETP